MKLLQFLGGKDECITTYAKRIGLLTLGMEKSEVTKAGHVLLVKCRFSQEQYVIFVFVKE